jgi:hypothetical protein
MGTTSHLHGGHICIIDTKEPYFNLEFALYDHITPIMRYKIAILRPYYANYVVRNSTPSYETLYRGTTSHLHGGHICIINHVINTKELYFYLEFAMYDHITPIAWYKIVPPRMKRSTWGPLLTYGGTTLVL